MSDEEKKTDEATAEGTGGDDPQVPIDFTTFVLSLSSSAAFHLGLAPHPEHEAPCENLPMAKQTIDILAILQEKTKGNLSGAEERLLGEVLYNLRISYVSAVQKCECSDGEGQ
jgi:hypothetical protein